MLLVLQGHVNGWYRQSEQLSFREHSRSQKNNGPQCKILKQATGFESFF